MVLPSFVIRGTWFERELMVMVMKAWSAGAREAQAVRVFVVRCFL